MIGYQSSQLHPSCNGFDSLERLYEMGLPRAAIHLLIDEAARSNWNGRIGTLGRQHVYATYNEVVQLGRGTRRSFRDIVPKLHREPELRRSGFLSDDSLYEYMGFDQSIRIDRSDYEDAEESLDLNSAETPVHLKDAFDVVLDSGTVEHIFEIGHAIKHCLQMAKPGGRIIHLTPSSNAVNHGFYSISPTLYEDFYRTNGCEVETLYLCRMKGDFVRGKWDVYDCLNAKRNWLPLGRLDGALWLTYAVIKKGNSGSSRTPQQSFYVDTWQRNDGTEANHAVHALPTKPSEQAGKAERLLAATKQWKPLYSLATYGVDSWRQWVNRWRERQEGRIPFRYVGRF